MSASNRLLAKRERFHERAARKQAAAKRIPFAGVHTTKKTVLGQRYNAVYGLPFSPSVAAVFIQNAVKPAAFTPTFLGAKP